ncbi:MULTISPECIES: MFS transporter [Staphylococcus]|uniref:MFS transporter n=1 Tax=Staphylococcus agnetis TaxID=985762 RepID=A0A2T4MIC3_9STAP|nr:MULTISPECIES: MFS transporter [Staphylococcus]NHM91718.1 MFS transporter [Staphylococcus sp. 10602379]NJI02734.1 MFS transporter [Staphylococcus agnetis]NJI12565.1 MFS transporter [Staphylococcus agnetis]PTH14556.1 MFS transporter [Staphylococcus agnetis]PTH28983.1 MFS transporter [Staphylococcus agnetis]
MASTTTRLFTKNYIVNFVVSLLLYLTMYLLIVVITQYAVEKYHISESLAGLVMGIFIVGSLFGRFLTGRFINVMGPKKIVLIGLAAFTVTQCLYFIEGSLILLMIVRFLNGFALAIATTATGTLVALLSPVERRAEGISLFSLSLVIGAAIGPFVGLMLAQHYPTYVLFTLCVGIALCAFVLALTLNVRFQTQPLKSEDKQFKLSHFVSIPALPIASVILICGLGYASVLTFIQIYAQQLQLLTLAGYYFIAYAIASILTRPLIGKIMDRYNENKIAYPALLLFSVGLAMLAVLSSNTGWLLLTSGALLGIGYGAMTAVCNVAALKVSNKAHIGIATSTFYIGLDFGLGFGPFLLGFITTSLGFQAMYGITAIIIFMCIALYWFVHGRYVKLK